MGLLLSVCNNEEEREIKKKIRQIKARKIRGINTRSVSGSRRLRANARAAAVRRPRDNGAEPKKKERVAV